MPIGDLLAQIGGEKSTGSSASAEQRFNTVSIKRKATDDLPTHASKTPRLLAPPPKTPQRPTNGAFKGPTPASSRPESDANRSVRPSLASKLPKARPTDPAKPKAPPKRGSYAEVLARAQRAQAVMGQVGKIQHKKVDKIMVRKDKEKSVAKPSSSTVQSNISKGYAGTSKPTQRNGTNGGAPQRADPIGNAARAKNLTATKSAAQLEAEKKVKKAASATTGYTGTARPKPGNPSQKSSTPRGGALLNVPAPRSSSSRRSRQKDDYDEELDDFIDYDDEEDDAPQYGYASDGSSDMEAGMDDIDDEEQRAEKIARREDIEQERLEKSLKVAKEERKRKALEGLRANRRG